MKVRLGDVATYINGYAFKPEDWSDSGLPIIRIQDLTGNSYKTNRFSGKYDKKFEVNDGDILISWSASIGVYVWRGEKAVLNQHIFKVKFDKQVNICKKFFIYQVENILKKAILETHGATMKHLTKPVFDSLPFYLPDIKKQNEISAILDKISEIISLRQRQLKKLDELVKSRFIEMFGEPLKNNKKWKTKKLKLIAPANEFTGDIEANGKMYWLLQLDMIESNTGKVLNKNLVTLDEIGASTIKFSSDNVLYSKLRPYLNKVVLPDEPGFATSEIIPLLPNEELNKIFLAFLLRDNGIVRFLNAHVSGSKMPRVQADIFWNLDIILPTITLQNQFADFVKQTDKSKLEIQKSLDKLEILKKSLMQKYF